MAQFIKEITLDIDKDLLQTIDAKQNDVSSRFILFDLFCNSLPLNLTGNSVQIYARKPDYSFIFNNVTIEDYTNGKVQVELTSQALAVVGVLNCELIITGSDNSILSTKPFNINVIESLKNDNAVESTNEFTALTTAVSTVTSYDNRITANTNHIGDLAGAGLSETDLATAVKNDRTNFNDATFLLGKIKTVDGAGSGLDADLLDGKDSSSLVPSGAVLSFAMTTPPNGWLKCNGQAISRTTYSALFTAIGTTYGTGDGSTTFNVPDIRGYFVRGFDDGRGIDSGRTFGSIQADDFKSHTHYQALGGNLANVTPATGSSVVGDANSSTTTATGGTETRPKNIALMYCIKY